MSRGEFQIVGAAKEKDLHSISEQISGMMRFWLEESKRSLKNVGAIKSKMYADFWNFKI